MSEFTALAVRPDAHLAPLNRRSRKELEKAYQEMMVLRGRAYIAQRTVGEIYLAALESVGSTLSAAEFIKAVHGTGALPGYAEIENVLRQQYLANVGQLSAIASHKVIGNLADD